MTDDPAAGTYTEEDLRAAVKIADAEILDVENQINRSDAKALGILSALAIVATALVIIGFVKHNIVIAAGSMVTLTVFLSALGTALLVLKPRFKGTHDPGDAEATKQDLLRRTKPAAQLDHQCRQLVGRRSSLRSKNHVLVIAFPILFAALGLLLILSTMVVYAQVK